MVDLVKILSGFGQSAVGKIQQNLATTGTNASGKTSRSLRFEVINQGTTATLRIIGRPYFGTVETGRKATPQFDKPSANFVASIREWLSAKGGNQGAAYVIARSIHQKGTKLWREGGRTNIYSNVRTSLAEEIPRAVLKEFINDYIRALNGGNGNL